MKKTREIIFFCTLLMLKFQVKTICYFVLLMQALLNITIHYQNLSSVTFLINEKTLKIFFFHTLLMLKFQVNTITGKLFNITNASSL